MNQFSTQSQTKRNEAWESVLCQLNVHTWSELARISGIDKSLISKARQGQKPLSAESRKKILDLLVIGFPNQENLEHWLADIGWSLHPGDEAYLRWIYQELVFLPSLHKIPRYYVHRPELENCVITIVSGESSQTFPILSRGVVISGMDGIGKSTLVRVALKDYPSLKESFPDGVFWIDCHESEYEQIIRQLADELDLEPALPVEAELWRLLRRDLRWRKALLVFDGVESIHTVQRLMEILGSSRSQCVFTTQQRSFEGELHHYLLSHFPVKSLTEEQGMVMLMGMLPGQITKRHRKIVRQIVTRVGGMPLAIEILARFVQATAISWKDLLIQINQYPMETLTDKAMLTRNGSVRFCFDLMYEYLFEVHPQAAMCFKALGAFARPSGSVRLLFRVAGIDIRDGPMAFQTLSRCSLIDIRMEAGHRIWNTHILYKDYATEKLFEDSEETMKMRNEYLQTLSEWLVDHLETTDQEAYNKAFDGVLVAQDDILKAIEIAIEEDKLVTALKMLVGSVANLMFYGQRMGELDMTLKTIEEGLVNSSNADQEMLSTLVIARQQVETIHNELNDDVVRLENGLSDEISPVQRVEIYFDLFTRHLVLGDLGACETVLSQANQVLLEKQPKKLSELLAIHRGLSTYLTVAQDGEILSVDASSQSLSVLDLPQWAQKRLELLDKLAERVFETYGIDQDAITYSRLSEKAHGP